MRGTAQIGKSPAIPPPIWKNPMEWFLHSFLYQSTKNPICSTPDLTMEYRLKSFDMTCDTKILPNVESSQPGLTIGRFFSLAASIQESLGSISNDAFMEGRSRS